jgi:polyphosphate kinase 2
MSRKNETSKGNHHPPGDSTRTKMKRKDYERELLKLQVELCHLQDWVRDQGLRIIVIFEGRDAAGKGGVIKRITERVSPRVFRTVALPAPTEREQTQFYFQRYIAHFPAGGEVVLFDRSWYNRAGVEPVMGFCTPEQNADFLRQAPAFERYLVDDGIILIKYFFDVGMDEQERRFKARIEDPIRQWKLSPIDVESWRRWWDYTNAYQKMLQATDTTWAPWYRVRADIKRHARLNCIRHLLSQIPYKELPFKQPELGKRKKRSATTPKTMTFKHEVPQVY